MKKSKIPPLKTNQNDKVLIGDELDDSEQVLICPTCNTTNTIVTLTNKTGSDLFCKRCSCVFDPQDDTLRHKSRLSVPLETEPALSTTPTVGADDVAIRHPPTLKDGAAQLAKRGTIKFTYYYDSSEH